MIDGVVCNVTGYTPGNYIIREREGERAREREGGYLLLPCILCSDKIEVQFNTVTIHT